MFVWLIENKIYIFIAFFLTVNDRCDIGKKTNLYLPYTRRIQINFKHNDTH